MGQDEPQLDETKRQDVVVIRKRALAVAVGVVVAVTGVGIGAFLLGRSTSPNRSANLSHPQSPVVERHHQSATTTVATAATTTSAPTTTSPPASTTTAPPEPLPTFVAGQWTGEEPVQIDFGSGCCNVVDHLTWSWAGTTAVGQGTWEYDACTEGCVMGPFTPYPATITLSDPVGGVFTKLTDTTSGPYGTVSNWYYPQNWPFGAS